MNCKQANQISIVQFLTSIGIEPVKTRGRQVWYLSPLRIEKTASFKVDTVINRWFDFGTGKGGDLIDLGTQLLNVSIEELLLNLADSHLELAATPITVRDRVPSIRLVNVKPLQHPSLLEYLVARRIGTSVAKFHCYEISYQIDSTKYFAIGFRNDVNGYEARNKYFKGSIGPKGISTRLQSLDEFSVFEGFIDYLSAMQMQMNVGSAIILNSVNQVFKAAEALRLYQPKIIKAFFDRDDAGRRGLAELTDSFSDVIDRSDEYRDYKDLNEMLMKQKQN